METESSFNDNAETSSQNLISEENEDEMDSQVITGFATFDDYIQKTYEVLRAGIKAANNLPSAENYNYYLCFPSFVDAKGKDGTHLLNVMQNVMTAAGVAGNITKRDVEDKFDLLLEANDILLDQANAYMDEESGVANTAPIELVVTQARKTAINGCWNAQTQRIAGSSENVQPVRLLAGKNVQRPQLSFKDKIDNSKKPWCPRIKDKPNSLKPLAIYLEEGENGEVFNHPYECELEKFTIPETQLQKRDPFEYKPLKDTPLILISHPSDIKILLNDLQNYKEIAIDLEHHSYRTFQGITCLMQISTADTDYLVDTLALRSELHELNEIFTKPSILKIFHGAELDTLWLQRDLSLYVVNMFDTHQAAKQLNLPYLSLAYLLKRYCNIDANKHFQLADWRIRPLPEELQKYAREDTHYLSYIKDILSNALIDAANGQINILKAVYDRSTEICKKVYVKPIWTTDSCMSMYRKSQKMFNNKQLYALEELHKWRDITAREEDDSTAYVLPNHMLLNIAETLPREMQGILACCNPIPPLVRQNLLKLHKLILKAREQPLIKPVLEEDLRQRLTQRNQTSKSEGWASAPHDIPSDTEARADLSCLLDNIRLSEPSPLIAKVDHIVTVFDSPIVLEEDEASTNEKTKSRKRKVIFVSPFERYKRVIPMVVQQEAQEREKQQKEEEIRMNKIQKEQEQMEESKNRVYEHFKNVYQNVSQTQQKKKPSAVPLGQMEGKKRKRDSSIGNHNEPQAKSKDRFMTSVPSLNQKIPQRIETDEDLEYLEDSRKQIQGSDTIQPIRQRLKGEKKATEKQLAKKGMMPSNNFDYKSVDFNSFQGGSKNTLNQVKFEQKMNKKKGKGRKRKKQKINV